MRKYDPTILLNAESVSDFLQKEFVRRLDGNASYSLRAFARDLDLSPSRLSESLNGKTGLSLSSVEKISVRLRLNKSERTVIRDLYLLNGRKNRGARDLAQKNLSKVRERTKIKKLDSEKFKALAEWYHWAILQMTDLKKFSIDADWVSRKLGVSPERIRAAIPRLQALGLLKQVDGKWMQGPEIMLTEADPVTPIRIYHKAMMQKAFRSIDEVPPERRFIQSMTFAMSSARYREVCAKVQELLKESWELSKDDDKDELYAINVQFFPVAKLDSDRSKGSQ